MGVHYFYTWVTSRYPMIRRPLEKERIPRVDHMYLDLNGVLHKCAKDSSALFKDLLSGKKMQEIFVSIVNYVNKVINTVKPTKSIFIAIDGVAPRAKMNNQRHRRYKQAVDSNNVDIFMTDVLKISQGSLDFKANSISPGTDFMFNLIRHMEFFIKRKLHEDQNWRNLKVWFSPGSVPGEGEHKIMNYLRSWSQSPEFNPRDLHCIYGNDSDLVMLSLKLHLPNIILLREANRYVDKDTVINYAAKRFSSEDPFELIYINILREYLYLELCTHPVEQAMLEHHVRSDFKNTNNAPVFNAERFIDDFVFLSCFIGNDFLPQLYCLSTKAGHFDVLLDLLRAFYIKEKKFLVFREKILWLNLRSLLASFRHLEEQFIDNTLKMFKDELKRFDQKRKFLDQSEVERMVNNPSQAESMQIRQQLEKMDIEEKDLFLFQYKKEYAKISRAKKRIQKMVELRNNRTKRREFYYYNYFSDVKSEGYREFSVGDVDNRIGQYCRNYFEGMRFKHLYYTIGCPTWVWYYRFENCPLITDMYHFLDELFQENLLSDLNFKVHHGQPFKPFVQLLHILPKQSLGLLPPLFQQKIFEKEEDEKEQETENNKTDQEENPEKVETEPEEKLLSKKEKFQKRCLIPTPMTDDMFIGFSFEGDVPSPEQIKEKANIKPCAKFVQFFPKKFMVEASDNLKNYTWTPLIIDIDRESMKKFILNFPWDQLSEEEHQRNRSGTNKVYEYDDTASLEVIPCLPGFQKFSAKVSEKEGNWEAQWGKDIRKLDLLYLKREKILAYTQFRLPSIITAFGGWGKVKLNFKIKYQREIAFVGCESNLLMQRMTKNPLLSTLDIHSKIKSGEAKIRIEDLKKIQAKTKKNKEKKLKKTQEIFNQGNVLVQNKLIMNEKKAEFMSNYQESCINFLRNKHDMQKFFYFDELFPKQLLFIRNEVLSGKAKDSAIHSLLKTLRDQFFIDIQGSKQLFKLRRLAQVYLGTPSFSVLEMKQHPVSEGSSEKEISFSLQWKHEDVKAYPLSMIFEASSFQTIFRYKHSLSALPKELDLNSNSLRVPENWTPIGVDLKTGNLISLGPEAISLYEEIQNGKRFKKIPEIRDYSIIKCNQMGTDNLKLKNLNDKMFVVDSQLLFDFGLSRKHKWVLWILMDSMLMFCDKQQSSSLVLGMKFDVGLNMMNLLNKKTFDFTTVSDLVKVYLERNYDLNTQDGLQRLLDDFVYLKFLHMYLFFQEEGKVFLEMLNEKKKTGKKKKENNGDKQKWKENKEDSQFIRNKYNEFGMMVKFIKNLVGKKTLNDWKKKILKLRRDALGKRKNSGSLEISQVRAFFEIENDPNLLAEILSDKLGANLKDFPNLWIEYAGFRNFLENLNAGSFHDMEVFMNSFPPDLYVTCETWKVKTFSIYLSQRGHSALKKYIQEQKELVEGLQNYPGSLWKLEKSHNDSFVKIRVKNRFRVKDLFPQYYVQSQKEESDLPSEVLVPDGKGNLVKINDLNLEPSLPENSKPVTKNEDQMDTEMTNNLKSMLGLEAGVGDLKEEKSLEEVKEEKSDELGVEDSLFNQLASEFSDKVVTQVEVKPKEAPPKPQDVNIKLFHCYANILKKDHSNLLLQPALSRHYSIDTILSKIVTSLQELKKETKPEQRGIKLSHLIIKSGNSSITWPPLLRKPPFHSLGDRVVHINPDNQDLKFGVLGTVIGIYKEKIEVLLDFPVIGADDLAGRVPHFRGKMLGFFDVFNLSKWRTLIFEEKHLESVETYWQGHYDYSGLISQIKKDSRHLKRKTYWNS